MARLVDAERQGKHIIYRIASPEVPRFWVLLRTLAEDRLFELQDAVRQLTASNGEWRSEDRAELLRKAQEGGVVVIDVRPPNEFEQAHLPFARSMPLQELRTRVAELPKDKPIVWRIAVGRTASCRRMPCACCKSKAIPQCNCGKASLNGIARTLKITT
jgi:hypothetical protein